MPLGALGVTAVLTGLDWGAWEWASDTGHSTIGVIAGVLMVPAAVAFVGLLVLTVAGLVRIGAQRAAARARDATGEASQGPSAPSLGGASSPSANATPSGRVAA